MNYPPSVQFEAGLIIDAVSKVTNVSPEQILSRVRYGNVAYARLACYWLCRNWSKAKMSWPAIGRAFNRDHATAIVGARRWEVHLLQTDGARELLAAAMGFLEAPQVPAAPAVLPVVPDLFPIERVA